MTFRFYDGLSNGVAFATSNVPNVPVKLGIASAAIPVDTDWFDRPTVCLGLSVRTEKEISPRTLVTAVPYAVKASSLIAPNPFDPTSYVPQHQGLELRWYQNTPFIDFTGSPNPNRDFDYRISCASPQDPRLVIGSDIAQNAIVIRRNGYVGIGGPLPETALDINGTARMTVCQITSDRAAKERFEPVKSSEVLTKLVALPISTWAYTNAPNIRHLGPVAQDFYAAFSVGEDDKHIATVDADGVALVAIQGLHEMLQEKDARIAKLESQMAVLQKTLEDRLTALESSRDCNESKIGVSTTRSDSQDLRARPHVLADKN